MSTPSISRISAGTPDGGRFAPTGRSEPDVTLTPTGLTPAQRTILQHQRTELRQSAELAQARADAAEMQLLADDLAVGYPNFTHVYVTDPNQGAAQVELYNEFGEVGVLGAVRPGLPAPPDTDLAVRLAQLAERNGSMFHKMLRASEGDGNGVPIADLASADKLRMRQESDAFYRTERVLERKVSAIVQQIVPDAVSWSVGVEEFDNGYFYSPSDLWAKKADGTEEQIDTWEIAGAAGNEIRQYLEDALAELGDRDGPLGERAQHTSDVQAEGE